MSAVTAALNADKIHSTVNLLIQNLISINDTTGQFLQRLDDGRVVDTKGWDGWDWTHGIGLYGLWNYYTITSSHSALDIITAWFDKQLPRGTTKNVNTMAVFLTLANVYERFGDERYLPLLEEWADWAMHHLPRTRFGGFQHITYEGPNVGELWDDTLMMTVMPLAKIGRVLGKQEYVEEAKRQFLMHVQFLSDTETGLWFHGWKFEDPANGNLGHNFARARWARGNCWVTMAIPEVLELLDLADEDPVRRHLMSVLEMQVHALQRLQTDEGMWRTLLDVSEEDGSYVEASATAGFAYGISKAVRLGYVEETFQEMAARAVQAVLSRIDADGEVRDVSFGTPMGHDLQHYLDIPRTSMPYGQAMAIMALGEVLRLTER